MRKVYRRRRLAALAVLAVLFLAALALFGALGTQASSQVQGDQLGPDGETRAEYIARVSGSDIPDAPAYALVTFDEDLPPVAAAAAVAAAPRMDAILICSTAPIAVPEPTAGEDRAAVIQRAFDRIDASYGQRPFAVSAAVVWGSGAPLADVASFFRTGASTSTVRTNVVVPLDKLVGVAHGSDDVVLTMTNGAQVTGAELAQRALAEEGFVTLLHPVEGPVNLYRMRRGATWKQFMMAAAENPTCPVKGCNKPADECQVHHIFSWAGGGWTNAKNLTTACAYHNGRNDDHRTGPPRNGRFERTARGVRWVNPWDPPPPDLVDTGPTNTTTA